MGLAILDGGIQPTRVLLAHAIARPQSNGEQGARFKHPACFSVVKDPCEV